MILAYDKIIPPRYFEHDPNMTNINNETVAILLAKNGIVPPE